MGRHLTKTSFKKGHLPWNKQSLELKCVQCGNYYKVTEYRLNKGSKYCSVKCKASGRTDFKKRQLVSDLYLGGKKMREISDTLGVPIGTISYYTNTLLLRRPEGESRISIRNRALKFYGPRCMICGFDTTVEVAHREPAKNGGKMVVENFYILCPNHHALYDRDLLTEKEFKCLPQ